MKEVLIDKNECAKQLGLSPHTLRLKRRQGILRDGIEYVSFNQRTYRYRLSLVLSALTNPPDRHAEIVDKFFADSEAAPEPTKRGRPKKVA